MIFECDKLKKEPENIILKENYHLLINVETTFRYIENNKINIEIPGMTIIELIDQLWKWISNDLYDDFIFLTMDDDEKEILLIKKIGNYWKIFSKWEKEKSEIEYDAEEIIGACKTLIKDVSDKSKEELGIKLQDFGIIENFG